MVRLARAGQPLRLLCWCSPKRCHAQNVAACVAQLREVDARWSLLRFGGVRHGFTNPAQALNPAQESFGYDAEAAAASWAAAGELLRANFERLAV